MNQIQVLLKKFSKKYDPINDWISENVKFPKNNCFFYSAVISLLFPEVKLIKGQHSGQYKEDTAHFYVELSDGTIIDPTKEQYKTGEILPEKKEVSAINNIDYLFDHPLFKTLSKQDQNRLKGIKENYINS